MTLRFDGRAGRSRHGLSALIAGAALLGGVDGCAEREPRALIVADASGTPHAATIDARAARFERERGRAVRVLHLPSGEAAILLASRGEADVLIVPEALPLDRFLAADHGHETGVIAFDRERLRVLAVNPKQHPKVDAQGAVLAAFLATP